MNLIQHNYTFAYYMCDDCGQGIIQKFYELPPDRCTSCKGRSISKQKSTKPNPFKKRYEEMRKVVMTHAK